MIYGMMLNLTITEANIKPNPGRFAKKLEGGYIQLGWSRRYKG